MTIQISEVVFMWFWWFILVCDLLVPFTMLIAGRMMWKHCPKHINGVIGYRTRRSMKNIETWKFAHDYCGRLWWKLGLWMIVPSVLVHIPFYHSDEDTIGNVSLILVIVQCIALVLSILPTEHALKKRFHDDGTRRQNIAQAEIHLAEIRTLLNMMNLLLPGTLIFLVIIWT